MWLSQKSFETHYPDFLELYEVIDNTINDKILFYFKTFLGRVKRLTVHIQ